MKREFERDGKCERERSLNNLIRDLVKISINIVCHMHTYSTCTGTFTRHPCKIDQASRYNACLMHVVVRVYCLCNMSPVSHVETFMYESRICNFWHANLIQLKFNFQSKFCLVHSLPLRL